MIRPHEEGLVLDQLRYAEEVKHFEEVPIDEAEVKPAELELARQLIDQAASDEFDATSYHDEVRARMMELIQQKVDGEEITVAPTEEPAAQIIDLMAALKASLGEDADEKKPAARAGKKGSKKGGSAKKRSSKKKAAGA